MLKDKGVLLNFFVEFSPKERALYNQEEKKFGSLSSPFSIKINYII